MLEDRTLKTNVSLVAFYGDKPPQLASLIRQLQTWLAKHELTKGKFVPYQLEQVHGTIIGCEGKKNKLGVVHQWFDECRQKSKYIDFDELVYYLQHEIDLPLTIRFGGYNRAQGYNFLSRNEHPYFRSFQLQAGNNFAIPVLIGWSWKKEGITLATDNLRRSFQQFNLLHKYHKTDDAIDNDFYLRLGTIDDKLSFEAIQTISHNVRDLLCHQSALYIPINQENIAFAQYQDLSLTPATTNLVPISKITADRLRQMYFTE